MSEPSISIQFAVVLLSPQQLQMGKLRLPAVQVLAVALGHCSLLIHTVYGLVAPSGCLRGGGRGAGSGRVGRGKGGWGRGSGAGKSAVIQQWPPQLQPLLSMTWLGLFYFYDKLKYRTHCVPSIILGMLHVTHFILLIHVLLLSPSYLFLKFN